MMKYAEFKEHKIQRTCTKKFHTPQKYKKYLQKDFHGRCGYCNMSEELVTVSFHVEHFVPEKIFKGKKDYLRTDYNNLMWSCPKCNLSKGDKYQGDLSGSSEIVNELFYNPAKIDYNQIFYRNELGGIDSDDPKGREMINTLKLYRPVHNLAWLLEQLEKLCDRLETLQEQEQDPVKKLILEAALGKVAMKCVNIERLFRVVYKGKKVFSERKETQN